MDNSLQRPENGPAILFFSGGTALRGLCQELIRLTHNSIHIITPFDSGGSSAKLRQAFHMPAVGDVRNRLMALADPTLPGLPNIFEFFAFRFPLEADTDTLRRRLARMLEADDPLTANLPEPMGKAIRSHLLFFFEKMADHFDLRGASIGNLVLTGGYLHYKRALEPVIELFSRLVQVRGLVRPVLDADLHLAARLADGRLVVGQHRLTGKENTPLNAAIERLCIVQSLDNTAPVAPSAPDEVLALIARADLICYPMGSFYTSLIANLLPRGVAEAIRRNPCPKIYIPNTGTDPEQYGMSLADCVARLLETLAAGCDGTASNAELLDFVLLDAAQGDYGQPVDIEAIQRQGVDVIDADLVSRQSSPSLDATRLVARLLSLT